MKVLRQIWGFYCIAIFFILVIIFLPVYFVVFSIFGKKALKPMLYFSHYYIIPLILFLFGVRLRVYGQENLDPNRTYVLVSNHQSKIDMLANAYSCPLVFQFLSKKEMKDIPLFGYIAKHLTILIDRKSKESKEKGFEVMNKRLNEGVSIMIYPEGTRNRTENLLKNFYDGAFRLAIESGYPLAVQILTNSHRLASPHKALDQSPGTITCHWAPPIETTNMTMDDLPKLREQVRETMLTYLDNRSDDR